MCGLYAVLWGKNAETKKKSLLIPLKNSEVETTVIASKSDDVENLSSEKLHGKEEKESEEKV